MFKKAIATTFLLGISVNTVFASELQDKQIIMKLMNNYINAVACATSKVQINNINIIDTPGFSSLDISKYTKKEIADSFIEFNNYQCRFKDCLHNKEIDCGVKEALNSGVILQSRYDNYLAFLKEAQNESSRFIYK